MQDVVVSSDGQFALSGSWDGTLRLWDLNNGSTTRRFVGHTKDVLSVAFSHDNRYDLLPFLCASFLAPVPSVSKSLPLPNVCLCASHILNRPDGVQAWKSTVIKNNVESFAIIPMISHLVRLWPGCGNSIKLIDPLLIPNYPFHCSYILLSISIIPMTRMFESKQAKGRARYNAGAAAVAC